VDVSCAGRFSAFWLSFMLSLVQPIFSELLYALGATSVTVSTLKAIRNDAEAGDYLLISDSSNAPKNVGCKVVNVEWIRQCVVSTSDSCFHLVHLLEQGDCEDQPTTVTSRRLREARDLAESSAGTTATPSAEGRRQHHETTAATRRGIMIQ
jgi:hypothetical protein